jgi:hypothetical protein
MLPQAGRPLSPSVPRRTIFPGIPVFMPGEYRDVSSMASPRSPPAPAAGEARHPASPPSVISAAEYPGVYGPAAAFRQQKAAGFEDAADSPLTVGHVGYYPEFHLIPHRKERAAAAAATSSRAKSVSRPVPNSLRSLKPTAVAARSGCRAVQIQPPLCRLPWL